jgi:hypothetical protein
MDTDRTFLGDVEYMHDFFPAVESTNVTGTRFTRAYVDGDECYFLPSIVGYVRDVLPARGQTRVRVFFNILPSLNWL